MSRPSAIAEAMTEAQLLACVRDLARIRGWLGYHTHRSQHSEAGFPDLVLLRGTRLIFAELKTERGKVTRPQQAWLDALTGAAGPPSLGMPADMAAMLHRTGPSLEVYVWRPTDWTSGVIASVLAA